MPEELDYQASYEKLEKVTELLSWDKGPLYPTTFLLILPEPDTFICPIKVCYNRFIVPFLFFHKFLPGL